MANISSLRIYHPVEDFIEEEQVYFKKLNEAMEKAEKVNKKGVWFGDSYDKFLADSMGLPPAKKGERISDRLKARANFARFHDGTLLVHCYLTRFSFYSLLSDLGFSKEGRNIVPDTWRIACMTGDGHSSSYTLSKHQRMYYARIGISLPEAISNLERYLNAAYKLPLSKSVRNWSKFFRFCYRVEELKGWLSAHKNHSNAPEKCLVQLDWGECAWFFTNARDAKRAVSNHHIIKYIDKLEKVRTAREAFLLEGETDKEITDSKKLLESFYKSLQNKQKKKGGEK